MIFRNKHYIPFLISCDGVRKNGWLVPAHEISASSCLNHYKYNVLFRDIDIGSENIFGGFPGETKILEHKIYPEKDTNSF